MRHLIDPSNVKTFQKILLDSDVIVYDLNTCDLKEAEFAIKTLKMMTNNEDKSGNNLDFWCVCPA